MEHWKVIKMNKDDLTKIFGSIYDIRKYLCEQDSKPCDRNCPKFHKRRVIH